MGCILEFVLEGILEGVLEGWFYLMTLIVPKEMNNVKVRKTLKIIVGVFSALLFVSMFLGLLMFISAESEMEFRILGKRIFFISVGISIAQILLGIISRYIQRKPPRD